MPNIKKWMETRPKNPAPQKGFMIYFKKTTKKKRFVATERRIAIKSM